LRRANAIIRFTARIVWAQILWFLRLRRIRRRAVAIDYAKNVERGNSETNGVHQAGLKRQQEINDNLIRQTGTENQYQIHEEMGKWMTDNVTVVRYNDRLKATDEKLLELQDRFKHISKNDSNLWATQAVPHARH
jgi:succinate dehydrogenase / fumarate reductase flavoprotein subunit